MFLTRWWTEASSFPVKLYCLCYETCSKLSHSKKLYLVISFFCAYLSKYMFAKLEKYSINVILFFIHYFGSACFVLFFKSSMWNPQVRDFSYKAKFFRSQSFQSNRVPFLASLEVTCRKVSKSETEWRRRTFWKSTGKRGPQAGDTTPLRSDLACSDPCLTKSMY